MAKKVEMVPVSARALIQRINRKLAAKQQKLKANRSDRWRGELGDFYVIDLTNNVIVDKRVDLETLGKGLECLGAWERLASDSGDEPK